MYQTGQEKECVAVSQPLDTNILLVRTGRTGMVYNTSTGEFPAAAISVPEERATLGSSLGYDYTATHHGPIDKRRGQGASVHAASESPSRSFVVSVSPSLYTANRMEEGGQRMHKMSVTPDRSHHHAHTHTLTKWTEVYVAKKRSVSRVTLKNPKLVLCFFLFLIRKPAPELPSFPYEFRCHVIHALQSLHGKQSAVQRFRKNMSQRATTNRGDGRHYAQL
jgi:hypothetical protein